MSGKRGKALLSAVFALTVCLLFTLPRAEAGEKGELVFGMSAAFTGANRELGMEFYRGISAYFNYVNAHGGVDGWTLRLVPANDGYNPAPCFNNTTRFIGDRVFALFSYMGTPTTTAVLPLLQKFEDQHVYMLFPFTGAQPLRMPPFGKYVYNLRASYFAETAGLVDNLVAIGHKRMAVFYQSDAYGRTGWDGIRRALAKHDLTIVSEAAYARGAAYEQDYTEAATHLLRDNPDTVLICATYAAQSGFIRDLRRAGFTGPIAGMSFADTGKMVDLLIAQGARDHRDYTTDLINAQVVPNYTDTSLPAVRLYRRVMDQYTDRPVAGSSEYTPRRYSFVSFEGFLNAMLLGEIIHRMSDNPRPDRLPSTIESIQDFDIGLEEKIHFGPRDHQGLDTVHFTTVVDGTSITLSDWEMWRL